MQFGTVPENKNERVSLLKPKSKTENDINQIENDVSSNMIVSILEVTLEAYNVN